MTDKKKKRGKKIRNIIIAVAAVALIGFFVLRTQSRGNLLPQVETTPAEQGDISQVVSISGTVVTDETKTYFIDMSAEVETVTVELGDEVSAGDLLISYNQEKLDTAVKQARLNKQQAAGSYADTTYYSNKVFEEYGLASFKTVDEQIDYIDELIDNINQQIEAKQRRFADTGNEFAQFQLDPDENGEPGDQDTSDKAAERQLAMQRAIQENQYAMQHDDEIESWQRQITELNQLKSDLSQTRLTDGAKSAASAQKQLTDLNANETIDSIEKLREGVTADFSGVITSLRAVEGMTTSPGQELLTIESTEKVKVVVEVTKYDMEKVKEGQDVTVTISGREYRGRVKKIAKSASKNDRGGSVVSTEIEILDADDQIILGMEADTEIHTAEKKNTILVPIEAVNVDAAGSFVYILEDGIVQRRDVTLGVASDLFEEVLTGLNAGDQVLTNITADITEGMEAISASDMMQMNEAQ